MSAPIAHIFLALQVLSGPLKDKFNEKEFVIGTSFPDIRYLKVIARDETHLKSVTFDQIKNEKNSFKAGMMFHAFVDEQREKYMIKNHVYNKLPKFEFLSHSLKFAEDQILNRHFDAIKYSNYFDTILDEERAFGIDESNLTKWHTFIKDYLNNQASLQNLLMTYFKLNSPKAFFLKKYYFSFIISRQIQKTVKEIINDAIINKIIVDFYSNFSKNLD